VTVGHGLNIPFFPLSSCDVPVFAVCLCIICSPFSFFFFLFFFVSLLFRPWYVASFPRLSLRLACHVWGSFPTSFLVDLPSVSFFVRLFFSDGCPRPLPLDVCHQAFRLPDGISGTAPPCNTLPVRRYGARPGVGGPGEPRRLQEGGGGSRRVSRHRVCLATAQNMPCTHATADSEACATAFSRQEAIVPLGPRMSRRPPALVHWCRAVGFCTGRGDDGAGSVEPPWPSAAVLLAGRWAGSVLPPREERG
jgi:hypothetical protein